MNYKDERLWFVKYMIQLEFRHAWVIMIRAIPSVFVIVGLMVLWLR